MLSQFIYLNFIFISQFHNKNTPKVRFFLSNFWGAQEEENLTPEGEDLPEEENNTPGEEAASEDKKEEKSKTSFFGKKKKDKSEQKVEELTDRLKRTMAEFDNFRKRTEKEKSSMYIIGAKEIVEKILPVVDNFERGLAQAQEGDAFADGMKMIYKQLTTTLDELGVKPIEGRKKPLSSINCGN